MGAGIAGKRLYCIVNPLAGGGKCGAAWRQILPDLIKRQPDLFWEYTEGAGTAGRQVGEAVLQRGAEAVVVFGGDGSLHDVINGIIRDDRLIRDDLILAFHPAGSACDLARTLYGKKHSALPDLLQSGVIRRVDVGRCTFRGREDMPRVSYFLNSFDAGAGADTCVRVNAGAGRAKRWLRNGRLAFMLNAFCVLMGFSYTDAEIIADEKGFSGRYIIIGVGNGRYIGGGMLLFPQASLDDGWLDLLLIEERSRKDILRLLPTVYRGGFFQACGVHAMKCKQVLLRTKRPIAIELDGEVPGYTEAQVHVLPRLLPLLFPAADLRA